MKICREIKMRGPFFSPGPFFYAHFMIYTLFVSFIKLLSKNHRFEVQTVLFLGFRIQQFSQSMINPQKNSTIKLEISQQGPKNEQNAEESQVLANNFRFQTEKQPFDNSYAKNDHLQRNFNETAIETFTQVITRRYNQHKRPISIVDLCCGYGGPTIALKKKLEDRGVQIEKIVGYDLSTEMISLAQQQNQHFVNLKFVAKNVETEFCDVNEYDFVVCLFGLQWMNNIQGSIQTISRSLKPTGVLLTLTPLYIHELHDYRTAFVNNSRWASCFDETSRVIKPLHSFGEDYEVPMCKYFTKHSGESFFRNLYYTKDQFITFLQSWFQQVRHIVKNFEQPIIKDVVAKSYLKEFVESIDLNLGGSVSIKENGNVALRHYFYLFIGEKIQQ